MTYEPFDIFDLVNGLRVLVIDKCQCTVRFASYPRELGPGHTNAHDCASVNEFERMLRGATKREVQ